jgi:hypothetical protein
VPAVAIAFFGACRPAYASSLTIDGTFSSSITSLSDAAAIEVAIDAASSVIEGDITSPNNITVAIDFTNMSSGLGENNSGAVTVSYFEYYNALKAVATIATVMLLGEVISPSITEIAASIATSIAAASDRLVIQQVQY